MKIKKGMQMLVIAVIMMTLPVPQTFSAVSEPVSAMSELLPPESDSSPMEPLELTVSDIQGDTPKIDDSLARIFLKDDLLETQIGNVEEAGAKGETIPQSEKGFWTRGKVLVTSGILLMAGIAVTILALAAGGSGSSSGSQAGPGSGSGGNDFIPPGGGGGAPGGADGSPETSGNPGGGGGGGDDSNGGGGSDETGPSNPEPSTFLLMGLGLLYPLIRRRGL